MSKCWYCNNELTNDDNPKHFGICNKCYNEMFRSGDTIIRSFINKISDLEAKLAESEEKKESYRLQNEQHHLQLLQFYSRLGVEAFGADIHEKALETLMIMKDQLAEKDAEIKQLKLDLGMFRSVNEFLNGYGIEKAREVLLQTEKTKQQDKISFAIERLEKVKKFVSGQLFIITKDCNNLDEAEAKGCNELREETIKEIDNQINELKKVK